jgi:hypothetical protein
MRMVFGLLRKGVRQLRHPPVAHPDIEVLALGKRCADALRIGVAFDRMLACASANRGAIAPLSFSRGTINLDQHSIVNLGAERALTASR